MFVLGRLVCGFVCVGGSDTCNCGAISAINSTKNILTTKAIPANDRIDQIEQELTRKKRRRRRSVTCTMCAVAMDTKLSDRPIQSISSEICIQLCAES